MSRLREKVTSRHPVNRACCHLINVRIIGGADAPEYASSYATNLKAVQSYGIISLREVIVPAMVLLGTHDKIILGVEQC